MQQIVLKSRPNGNPSAENFAIEEAATPEAGPGQLLVKTLWLSVDPYVRLMLDETTIGGIPGMLLGQPPLGRAVSRVIKSNHPNFAPGDIIEGRNVWAEEAVVDPVLNKSIKLDFGSLPLSYAVGALGMPGQTSYASMVDITHVKAGETVVISAAAGAVGAMAGQIAKILGARVVGIAGGPDKCKAVEALGFDACIDYRASDFDAQLAAATPGGINVYLENVGGDMTRRVIVHAAYGVRVALCGVLTNYAVQVEKNEDHLPEMMRLLFLKGVALKGFAGEQVGGAHALAANRAWIEEGKLKPLETVLNGIDVMPAAFAGIYRGNTYIGKVVVKVAD